MATPLKTASQKSYRIQRVTWNHDRLVEEIIKWSAVPGRHTQRELAKHLGVTETWVSNIVNSDAFQARLAERKSEVVDPLLRGALDEAMQGLVNKSIDILRDQLAKRPTFDNALEVFKAAGKSLGMGQKSNIQVNVNGENSLVSVLSGMSNTMPERVVGRDITPESEVKILGKVDGTS